MADSGIRDGGDQPLDDERPLPGGDPDEPNPIPDGDAPVDETTDPQGRDGQTAFVDDATGRAYERVVADGEAAIAGTQERIEALEAEAERAAAADPGPREEVEPE